MKFEHKELIHDYLHIKRLNNRIEQRLYRIQKEFYAQNFYGKIDFYDPLSVTSKGFRVDSKVSDYVDFINACERNIKKNLRRQHYFKKFTDRLDPHTYSSLKRRYSNIRQLDEMQIMGHDEQVLDEILEIEEAISHEFETPMYINVDTGLSANYMQMKRNENSAQVIDAVAELLGVV